WQKDFGEKQIDHLYTLWVVEAKALKLAFSTTMTKTIDKELQESLKQEHNMLIT
ncbi:6605_t:CDS:1, partial [Dentiscutata erythropus]